MSLLPSMPMIGWFAWMVSSVVNANDYVEDYFVDDDRIDYNLTNCTNNYCISNEDYIDRMVNYVFPKFWDWVLITTHAIVFVVGLVGNGLVCIAVYRNHSMRTITNYFIVNLAVADFLVLLFCLPITVLWDVTETWFLGLIPCKAVPYLQTVSVSVSIFTLTFISLDRWYAVCFPLRFRSTTGRATTAIAVIWVIALLFDVPDLVALHTVPSTTRVKTILFTQCARSWSMEKKRIFTFVKLIILYFAPLLVMTVMYWQIVKVLWRNDIPGHTISSRGSRMNEIPPATGGNPEGQLRSRRKAAKMLVTIVITFAICYLPVHILSILRYTIVLPSNKWMNATSLIAHGLCYFNSAVNPVIYNFMSDGNEESLVSGKKYSYHRYPEKVAWRTKGSDGSKRGFAVKRQSKRRAECSSGFQENFGGNLDGPSAVPATATPNTDSTRVHQTFHVQNLRPQRDPFEY